jgi:hypothetical protein
MKKLILLLSFVSSFALAGGCDVSDIPSDKLAGKHHKHDANGDTINTNNNSSIYAEMPIINKELKQDDTSDTNSPYKYRYRIDAPLQNEPRSDQKSKSCLLSLFRSCCCKVEGIKK